ncbi:serine hydrolase, partial [Acinetobacter baumannii]
MGDSQRCDTGFVNCAEGDLFDLASLTKVMVTTPIVLSLVMEGSVDLDAPVGDYLAEWSGRDVTVRRLLSHTSGL